MLPRKWHHPPKQHLEKSPSRSLPDHVAIVGAMECRGLVPRAPALPPALSFVGLRRALKLGILACLFLLPLVACGSSAIHVSGPEVSMTDNDFSPKELHINVGQTVTWVNNGQ